MDEILLEKVMKHYDEYVKGRGKHSCQGLDYNARSAVVYDNGDSWHRETYSTCYGNLNRLDRADSYDAIFLQIQKGGVRGKSLYYEYLLNFSPYRNAFITKDAAKLMKDKVAILTTDVDSRLVGGAGITFRHPWEHWVGRRTRDSVNLWTKMVEAGVHPDFAFIISMHLVFNPNTSEYSVAGSTGHHAIQMPSEVQQLNFLNHKLSPQLQTFRQRGGYDLPSRIFNTPVKKPLQFSNWLTNLIKGINQAGRAINPFAVQQVSYAAKGEKIISAVLEIEGDFFKEYKTT